MLHISAIVICEFAGTAFTMYYLAGFFGAAAYGQDTEGNILENSLGSNTKAQGALNIFMTGIPFLRIYSCFRFAKTCESLQSAHKCFDLEGQKGI